MAVKKAKPTVVYLLYTKNATLGWQPTLLKVYKKSSYQDLYNRMADIAEQHGTIIQVGNETTAIYVQTNSQVWWAERHETE